MLFKRALSATFTIILSFLWTSFAHAAPQRMALVGGDYHLGTASDGGGRVGIPAYCLDIDRNVANAGHSFALLDAPSSQSYVIVDGQHIGLQRALESGLISFAGTGDMEVEITAGPAAGGRPLDIHVEVGDQLGDAGERPRDRATVKEWLLDRHEWHDSVQRMLWSKLDMPAIGYSRGDAIKAFQQEWKLENTSGVPDEFTSLLITSIAAWNALPSFRKELRDQQVVPRPELVVLRPRHHSSLFVIVDPASKTLKHTDKYSDIAEAIVGSADESPLVALAGFDAMRTENFSYSLDKVLRNRTPPHKHSPVFIDLDVIASLKEPVLNEPALEVVLTEPADRDSELDTNAESSQDRENADGTRRPEQGKPLVTRLLKITTQTREFFILIIGRSAQVIESLQSALSDFLRRATGARPITVESVVAFLLHEANKDKDGIQIYAAIQDKVVAYEDPASSVSRTRVLVASVSLPRYSDEAQRER